MAELEKYVDYWPTDILDLVRPVFEASRGEERLKLLGPLVELSRQDPDRVLPLLSVPAGSSRRLQQATREAFAATLARKTVRDGLLPPESLCARALDPADSLGRTIGRQALWLLAAEKPAWLPWVRDWARKARLASPLPVRVELGRLLGELGEMKPIRGSAWPAPPPPRAARLPPGTWPVSGLSP